MSRANALVAAGAVLVAVGIGLAFVVAGDDGGDGPEPQVAVVVARADLEPGESGDDLVAAGEVRVAKVPESELEPGAVRATEDVQGTIVAADVAEGAQVPAAALRDSVLRGEAIAIPEGMQAVAITVPFTAGVAGYAGPGDVVNVYSTIAANTPGVTDAPLTRLLMSDVTVLDVSTEVAPQRSTPAAGTATEAEAGARTSTDQITLLLALDPADAEQVLFAASVDELSFALAGEGQDGLTTPGATYGPGYIDGRPSDGAAPSAEGEAAADGS